MTRCHQQSIKIGINETGSSILPNQNKKRNTSDMNELYAMLIIKMKK